MKKAKPEKTREEILKGQRSTAQRQMRYRNKKRYLWAKFSQTPEGKEVRRRQDNAEKVASKALKKAGYKITDLNPFRHFQIK